MMTRASAWSLFGLALACGSRSDLTRATRAEFGDASASAGRSGLGGAGSGGTPDGDDRGRAGAADPLEAPGFGGAGTRPDGAGAGAGSVVDPDRALAPGIDWNAPPSCPAAPPSLDETLSAALADLVSLAAGDRAFMRYVGTGYRRTVDCDGGEQARGDGQRELALLVNLTSGSGAIALPTPVDSAPDELLRIDLRAYGWERERSVGGITHRDGWEAIAAQSALAVEFTGPESEALRAESGTAVPLLWFSELLVHSLQGQVYYELLHLPDTLGELGRRLDVPLDEPASGDWLRAGTTVSRVVRQQRGVARYRSATPEAPVFWLVLDFSRETALPGVLLDPLTFEADSSAALFTLPNGLPGFFTADGAGRRISESPIMRDTEELDFVARNAVSCLRCHAGGPASINDEVRGVALANVGGRADETELLAIDAAYPPEPVLASQVEADAARVQRGLAAAGGTGEDVQTMLSELQSYRGGLSLARAAGALFVGEAELRASLPSLPPAFAAAAFSGTLDRSAFERDYRQALCILHQTSANRPAACP